MTKMMFLFPLALGAAFPAIAAEPLPVESRTVVTADLDLSSEAGRATLDRRLAGAARDVCGRAADIDLEGRNDVRACKVAALGKARAAADEHIANLDTARPIQVATR